VIAEALKQNNALHQQIVSSLLVYNTKNLPNIDKVGASAIMEAMPENPKYQKELKVKAINALFGKSSSIFMRLPLEMQRLIASFLSWSDLSKVTSPYVTNNLKVIRKVQRVLHPLPPQERDARAEIIDAALNNDLQLRNTLLADDGNKEREKFVTIIKKKDITPEAVKERMELSSYQEQTCRRIILNTVKMMPQAQEGDKQKERMSFPKGQLTEQLFETTLKSMGIAEPHLEIDGNNMRLKLNDDTLKILKNNLPKEQGTKLSK